MLVMNPGFFMPCILVAKIGVFLNTCHFVTSPFRGTPAQRKFQVVFDFAPRGKAQECGPDVGTSMVGAPWVAD